MAGPAKLDHQLITVYKNSNTGLFVGPLPDNVRREFVTLLLKPIDSIDPDKGQMMRAGVPVANLRAVSMKTLEALTTVIAQAAFGNGSTREDIFRDVTVGGRRIGGIMTIRQFMELTAMDQMSVINTGWERVCTKKAYNQLSSQMFEPTQVVVSATNDPVPSGAVPTAGGGMTVGYTNVGRVPDAYCGLGVGFRVDGSGTDMQNSINRVLGSGMSTQLKNQYLMRNIKGWEVQGTIVDLDTNAPRVWRTKNDLFNESAVCISRNLYGATAFPMREMEGDDAVLWAVDVRGLIGFDTETYQKGLGANRQWRPGEKAYKRIPKGNLIGYVAFEKHGAPDTGGWRFRIPAGSTWTYIGDWAKPGQNHAASREAQVRTYVEAQLAAWAGPIHTIGGAYDFA